MSEQKKVYTNENIGKTAGKNCIIREVFLFLVSGHMFWNELENNE